MEIGKPMRYGVCNDIAETIVNSVIASVRRSTVHSSIMLLVNQVLRSQVTTALLWTI